jgi:hypothetical protein
MQTPSENDLWANQMDHLDTLPDLNQFSYQDIGFEAA